jgi:hypothetical protein
MLSSWACHCQAKDDYPFAACFIPAGLFWLSWQQQPVPA